MLNEYPLGDGRHREPQGRADRAPADREVPFGARSHIADAVHAWLDGLTPEREVRRAEWSHEVAFWKRLDGDLQHRRQLRTPAGLNARIMNALPRDVPTGGMPWWRRQFAITTSAAILTMLTLIALTAFVTASVVR